MTAHQNPAEPGPGKPLYGSESASDPVGGISGGSDPLRELQTGAEGFGSERGAPDNPLRQLIADAVRPWLLGADEADVQHCAAAVVDAILPTTRLLGALHQSAHDDVMRVIDLYERWVKAGPPPPGASTARWWDVRLAELHAAILGPKEPAHDAGPSVAEATADDRAWPLQREGE